MTITVPAIITNSPNIAIDNFINAIRQNNNVPLYTALALGSLEGAVQTILQGLSVTIPVAVAGDDNVTMSDKLVTY